MAFYIDCCIHHERPLLGVFQKFYQLKVKRIGTSAGSAHFSVRQGCKPLIQNRISNLHQRKDKYIRVVCKLNFGFSFPTQWSLPRESVCTKSQSEDAQGAERRYKRLKKGRILDLVELVSVRNVFQHCLKISSQNGYRTNYPTIPPYCLPSRLGHITQIMNWCTFESLHCTFTVFVAFAQEIGKLQLTPIQLLPHYQIKLILKLLVQDLPFIPTLHLIQLKTWTLLPLSRKLAPKKRLPLVH